MPSSPLEKMSNPVEKFFETSKIWTEFLNNAYFASLLIMVSKLGLIGEILKALGKTIFFPIAFVIEALVWGFSVIEYAAASNKNISKTAELILNTVLTVLLGVAIFAGMVFFEAAVPFIFAGIIAVKLCVDIGKSIYFFRQAWAADSPDVREYFLNLAKNNTIKVVINALVITAIVFSLILAPHIAIPLLAVAGTVCSAAAGVAIGSVTAFFIAKYTGIIDKILGENQDSAVVSKNCAITKEPENVSLYPDSDSDSEISYFEKTNPPLNYSQKIPLPQETKKSSFNDPHPYVPKFCIECFFSEKNIHRLGKPLLFAGQANITLLNKDVKTEIAALNTAIETHIANLQEQIKKDKNPVFSQKNKRNTKIKASQKLKTFMLEWDKVQNNPNKSNNSNNLLINYEYLELMYKNYLQDSDVFQSAFHSVFGDTETLFKQALRIVKAVESDLQISNNHTIT